MKIAGVVIWYNPTNEDKNNINTYLPYIDKLYIIDNSPIKNNINNENKKINYIFNNNNIGIAEGLNKAAKMAINEGYNWLLTMDQDTIMNEECFKKFQEVLKTQNIENIGIITPWHRTKLDTKKPDEEYTYPNQVMTSANLVNLSILDKIGYFDEKLFIDGVDIEYGLRLNKSGYRIMQCNDIYVEHNLGDIKYHRFLGRTYMCTNHNYLRQYYMARNYRYIRDMYIDYDKHFCEILVKIKSNIFKIVMYEPDKFRKIKYMLKGIRDYRKKKVGKIKE